MKEVKRISSNSVTSPLAELFGLDLLVKYNKPVVFSIECQLYKRAYVYYCGSLMKTVVEKIIKNVYLEGYEILRRDLPHVTIKVLEEFDVYDRKLMKEVANRWINEYKELGYSLYGRHIKPPKAGSFEVYSSAYQWKNKIVVLAIMRETLSDYKRILGVFTSHYGASNFINEYYPIIPHTEQPYVPYVTRSGVVTKVPTANKGTPIRKCITVVYAKNDLTRDFMKECGDDAKWLTMNESVNPFTKNKEEYKERLEQYAPLTEQQVDDLVSLKKKAQEVRKAAKVDINALLRFDNDNINNE